jgi:stress response protein SCP2
MVTLAINLQKGQKIDLTKGNSGLSKLVVGLGWDAIKKGFLGFGGKDVDCDASAIMLDANGKLLDKKFVIYFGNLKSPDGSVSHSGDNTTGAGDGDDETILVELARVPSEIAKIVFVVNIYDCINRKQDFGLIQNAYIRVIDGSNNQELLKYNLSDNYAGKTSLLTGEIYRHGGDWKFGAIGEGTHDVSLSEILKRYV